MNPTLPLFSASLIIFSLCRFIIGENRWMPFSQNLLRIPELGAHTILGINYVGLANKWRENLTWLSGLGGFLLGTLLLDSIAKTGINFWRITRGNSNLAARSGRDVRACGEQPGTRQSDRRLANSICAVVALLLFFFQFAFNTLQSTFSDIDRYYLFPLLGALLVLALAWRRHRVKLSAFIAVPLLFTMAAYSLAATQDMMAWNRARWTAIDKLEAQGVDYKKIDGGAEYNYARDPMLFKSLILHETSYELTHRGQPPRDQWRWWSVQGEEYIISFNSIPGYDVVAKEPYWTALGGKREILTLHQATSTP
jgi:hypothetical protein